MCWLVEYMKMKEMKVWGRKMSNTAHKRKSCAFFLIITSRLLGASCAHFSKLKLKRAKAQYRETHLFQTMIIIKHGCER